MGMFDRQVARRPDHYPWAADFKKAMWHGFWTAEKFDFVSDVKDYHQKMTPQLQEILVRTVTAIAQIEVQVKPFWSHLGDHLPNPSIAGLGVVMAGVEEIHNDAYEKVIVELGLEHIFEDILKIPAIKGRVAYLTKHTKKVYTESERKQFIYSLILFTMFVERVSLFSQFYIVLWMNRYLNVLNNTSQQIKYTRNEEMLHAQAGMKIVNTLREEYPQLFDKEMEAKIYEEAGAAFAAECDLIDWMLGDFDQPGLNKDILQEYVKKQINESLEGIGYKAIFNIDPAKEEKFRWMDEGLYANPKVDFFNSDPTSYVKADRPVDDDDF